jgi:hypothetical protein
MPKSLGFLPLPGTPSDKSPSSNKIYQVLRLKTIFEKKTMFHLHRKPKNKL